MALLNAGKMIHFYRELNPNGESVLTLIFIIIVQDSRGAPQILLLKLQIKNHLLIIL